MSNENFSIRGVIPNLVTPFRPDGEIAWDAVEREIAYLDRSDVDGIGIGAYLGQTAGLTAREFLRLCETARRLTRKPLVCTILPDSEPEAMQLLDAASGAKADAVLVAQPHYLFQPDSDSLLAMFERLQLRARTPVLLANILSSAQVDLATLTRLMGAGLIDGVLQGGGDAHLLVDLLRLRPRVPVFCGLEDLHYVGLLLGAEGLISDLATVFPADCVALYKDFLAGRNTSARERHERLLRLWRVLDHPVDQLARVRLALSAQGRDGGSPRSPYRTMPESAREVTDALQREGVGS